MLAKKYKVIAMDLQAHGRTSDRAAPESFEQDADDVVTLLKNLNIPKTYFFGFSNGGTTAVQIAIRHPEIVDKIILGVYEASNTGKHARTIKRSLFKSFTQS
jgi:pimeloyl-ACP methyl ester carboxylesterase